MPHLSVRLRALSFGGSRLGCRARRLFPDFNEPTVLLPESFRGGCSFGAGNCRSLPSLTLLTRRILIKNHIVTFKTLSTRPGSWLRSQGLGSTRMSADRGHKRPKDDVRLGPLYLELPTSIGRAGMSLSCQKPTLRPAVRPGGTPLICSYHGGSPCGVCVLVGTQSAAASRGFSIALPRKLLL
jgi:hypothetical protein